MATNYKYLKDNNLFEAHLRFKQMIGEGFGYGYKPIEEAGDEENNPQDPNAPQGGGMPPMDAGIPPQGGQDPNAGGGIPPQGDPMGGAPDPNGGAGMPPQDGQMPPGGSEMPQDGGMDAGGDMMPPAGDEAPMEEDNVLDIDDLTDAQEKVNDKVNAVGHDLGRVDDRIEKLLGAIDKLQNRIDANNREIADLKGEFEKRNPTQVEKLNLRSQDSFPFVEKPMDYWDKKMQTSNYIAYADNDEPTTQEYEITNNDVDDFDEREVADSFAITDDLTQDIKKIFGLS